MSPYGNADAGYNGFVQSFSRAGSVWTETHIRGSNIRLEPQGGYVFMPAGSVSSYNGTVNAPAGSTTSTTYVASPFPSINIVVKAGCAGILIWGNATIGCAAATAASPVGVDLAVGYDGASWMGVYNGALIPPAAGPGWGQTCAFSAYYAGPAVGTHTISIWWASPSGATLVWSTGKYSSLSALAIYA